MGNHCCLSVRACSFSIHIIEPLVPWSLASCCRVIPVAEGEMQSHTQRYPHVSLWSWSRRSCSGFAFSWYSLSQHQLLPCYVAKGIKLPDLILIHEITYMPLVLFFLFCPPYCTRYSEKDWVRSLCCQCLWYRDIIHSVHGLAVGVHFSQKLYTKSTFWRGVHVYGVLSLCEYGTQNVPLPSCERDMSGHGLINALELSSSCYTQAARDGRETSLWEYGIKVFSQSYFMHEKGISRCPCIYISLPISTIQTLVSSFHYSYFGRYCISSVRQQRLWKIDGLVINFHSAFSILISWILFSFRCCGHDWNWRIDWRWIGKDETGI